MENLLNLIWLIVASVAIYVWRFRWLKSRQNPRARVLVEAVAIGCVLVLLLPVISLTDDLHPEIVIVDAASGKRNACLLAAGASHTPHAAPAPGAHAMFAVLPSPFAHLKMNGEGILLPAIDIHFFSVFGSASGRSPPSVQ
jgi:hypothetical protein